MFFCLIVDGVREGPFSLERAAQRAVLARERGHRVELDAIGKTEAVRSIRRQNFAARVEEITLRRQQRGRGGSQLQHR